MIIETDLLNIYILKYYTQALPGLIRQSIPNSIQNSS